MPVYVSSIMCSSSGGQNCIILYYTAPGIITLCGWPSGAHVERGLCTGRPPTECAETRCCI